MIVLGFNGFPRIAELFARLYGHTPDSVDRHSVLGHDAAAALFVDRVLVAAVEEERLNRQKKTSAFPIHAIEWCLEQASISYDDVDHFAFGWNFSDAYADAAIREIAASPFSAAAKFQALSSLGILRSEEHTSELQSQSNLVCRLLLEKKKKKKKKININKKTKEK